MAEKPDIIFISYAREDVEAARRLYQGLSSEGLNVWFDEKSLLPGHEWKLVINKVIRNSRFFLAIFSRNSINKKGYVQKEIREAIEVSDELPPFSSFIIPILLEKVEIPYPRISDFHYVDMSMDWEDGLRKILLTIRTEQSSTRGVNYSNIASSQEHWATSYIIRTILLGIQNLKNQAEKDYDINQKSSTNIHTSNEIGSEHVSTLFNIINATELLNNSHEFYCKQLAKNKDEESWIIMKPLLIIGKESTIQINITIRYDTNEIIFIMPMYGNGSEGLVGENLEAFYNLIHQFNSRTNGGFFTKYTYDDTYAPIFIHHIPLNRMDMDWFKNILYYFMDIHIAFLPMFDKAILDYELKFQKNAAIKDPIKNYLHNLNSAITSKFSD